MTLLLALACAGPSVGPTPPDTGPDSARPAGDDSVEPDDSAPPPDTDSAPAADADGDGHAARESGGDDCDDTNAWIHPEAIEYCDEVDQDCDGDPILGADCATTTPAGAAAVPFLSFDYQSTHVGLVPDLTGDGVADIEVQRLGDVDVLVYEGGTLSGTAMSDEPSFAWHHVLREGFSYLQTVHDGGDMDGDGQADLLVAETMGSGAAVHLGPLPGPAIASWMVSDADELWPSNMQSDYWDVVMSGIDLDGDGRAETLADNDSSGGPSGGFASDLTYELYFGGASSAPCDVMRDDGGGMSAGSWASVIGDGDGDGLPEFGFGTVGAAWIVSGAEARMLCESYTEDVAALEIPNDVGREIQGSVGDLDGDGLVEWLLVDPDADPGADAIFVLSAGVVQASSVSRDDALGSYVEPASGYPIWSVSTLDFDGDSLPEVLIQEGSGGPTHILRGGTLPALHADFSDGLTFDDDNGPGSVCGTEVCKGDFDDDGFDDLIVTSWTETTEPFGVGIIRGFEVPWDDTSLWGP